MAKSVLVYGGLRSHWLSLSLEPNVCNVCMKECMYECMYVCMYDLDLSSNHHG